MTQSNAPLFKGLNVFFYPDGRGPDQVACHVCGDLCRAERGRPGPSGLAAAIQLRAGGGAPGRHDVFTCPHASEPWHARATALRLEADRQVSPRLRQLVLADLKDALSERAT